MENTSLDLKTGHFHTLYKYISSEAPTLYAEASGDRNPLHLDASIAAERGMDGTVLHGMCSLAFMLSGLMIILGGNGFIKSADSRFSAPVKPGEVIAFKYFLKRAESGEFEFAVSARNREGHEVLKNARVIACDRRLRQE